MTAGVLDPIANKIVDIVTGGDTLTDTGAVIGSVISLETAGYTSHVPSKYGDGSDGAFVYSGPVTLSRDTYLTDGTFIAGAAVNVRANFLFITGTGDITAIPTNGITSVPLTTNGTNTLNGNPAVVNVAGAIQTPGNGTATVHTSGMAGVGGATNAGTNAASPLQIVNSYVGGLPGSGSGAAGAGATGAGGAIATLALLAQRSLPRHGEIVYGLIGGVGSPGAPSGGGDGTATASGAGGGGGVGGPVIQLPWRRLLRSAANPNTSCIVAKGGNGGAGGIPAGGNRGGGCGAAGAGGGAVRVICEELSGTTHVGCVDVTGGNGGNSGTGTGTGTAGTGAPAGFGGDLIRWCQSTTPLCVLTDKTAVGGNLGVGTAGGVATPALCDL